VLRVLDGDQHFVDGPFLGNIRTTRNPSMRGFLIEQACLTYVRHNGLLLPAPFGLLKPDQVVYFDAGEESHALGPSSRSACVLYIPRPFNYRAIDAILRYLTFGQNEHGQQVITGVLLVPIQVTISASHKPSPEAFYPKHQVWLEDIDVGVPRQHVFVWLRRDHQASVAHEEHVRGTREQRIVTPAYQEVTVTFNTLSGDLHVSTSPQKPSAHPSSHAAASVEPIPFSLRGQCTSLMHLQVHLCSAHQFLRMAPLTLHSLLATLQTLLVPSVVRVTSMLQVSLVFFRMPAARQPAGAVVLNRALFASCRCCIQTRWTWNPRWRVRVRRDLPNRLQVIILHIEYTRKQG
jgi:hypothetical protein